MKTILLFFSWFALIFSTSAYSDYHWFSGTVTLMNWSQTVAYDIWFNGAYYKSGAQAQPSLSGGCSGGLSSYGSSSSCTFKISQLSKDSCKKATPCIYQFTVFARAKNKDSSPNLVTNPSAYDCQYEFTYTYYNADVSHDELLGRKTNNGICDAQITGQPNPITTSDQGFSIVLGTQN